MDDRVASRIPTRQSDRNIAGENFCSQANIIPPKMAVRYLVVVYTPFLARQDGHRTSRRDPTVFTGVINRVAIGLTAAEQGHTGYQVNSRAHSIHLTDEQRLDWLRLIRSQNVGPRGIMAQTPQEHL